MLHALMLHLYTYVTFFWKKISSYYAYALLHFVKFKKISRDLSGFICILFNIFQFEHLVKSVFLHGRFFIT